MDKPGWEIVSIIAEAVGAIGTLLLGVIVLFQSRKVKTLTDVVESINEQTKIYQQILKFEIRSRITEAQPLFSTFKISDNSPFYELRLKNRGQKARNVTIDGINNLETINIQSGPSIIIEELFVMSFTIKKDMLPWSFDLIYETGFGETYKQTVTGTKNQYNVLWPETVL